MARRSDGEGTIKKRILTRANGTTYTRWYARITLRWDGKRKKSKDGPLRKTQKEAHGDLVELERQQKSGRLKDGAQQKLSHYVQHWLERARRVKKWRTYQTYEGDLRNHVLPYLGHKRLDKISRADVQQMVDAAFDRATAQEQSGAAVARKARAVLRTALQDAVDLELLERNPCERIKCLRSQYLRLKSGHRRKPGGFWTRPGYTAFTLSYTPRSRPACGRGSS